MEFSRTIFTRMALPPAATAEQQQQQQNAAVLRSMLPESPHHDARKSPPTWLNTSLLRQQHSHFAATASSPSAAAAGVAGGNNFLHLQTSNSDSSNSNHGGGAGHNDDLSESMNFAKKMSQQHSGGENSKQQQIDAQLTTPVAERSGRQILSVLGQGQPPLDDKDLDQFMAVVFIICLKDELGRHKFLVVFDDFASLRRSARVIDECLWTKLMDMVDVITHYVLLLSSFKEQLQQHVRVHAMEAVMACWELEQSLQSSWVRYRSNHVWPDDDDRLIVTQTLDGGFDGPDGMGFGPLVPTEVRGP
ncbi:hypothetical protein HAX54_013838 [Datura stramonium]|uniref:KNOX2 domain-containing protein n=1 Tax=Datura stramonium TaxID=4076 RepID=A0ABS8TM26_DATST|nr:hypothetical protein [Datura stramonium]